MPQRSLLYVGSLQPGQTAARRAETFSDEGWKVATCDWNYILEAGSFLERKLLLLGQFGPLMNSIEQQLIDAATALQPGDIVFFDKPVFFSSDTINKLSDRGLLTVSYMPDDPFGPRRDGLWRQFNRSLPLFDLHIVPRSVSVGEFKSAGAKRVLLQPFSFDSKLHHPRPIGQTGPDLGYSYIGSPHEDRPVFLVALKERLERNGAKLTVNGPRWSHLRHRNAGRRLNAGPPLWGPDYRDAIWNSRAALSFITRLNRDDLSHKAIEIAACGIAPIVEPSPHHNLLFKDGVSAVFYNSLEDCVDKLLYYWTRPDELEAIGAEAAKRVREIDHSEVNIVRLIESEFGK